MKIIFLIIFSLTSGIASLAWAGGGVDGGGGDPVAQDFITVARNVEAKLLRDSGLISINLKTLDNAINTTSVESSSVELTIDKVHKACINYPDEKRIVVSKSDWLNLSEKSKEALVLHEFLGILRTDDHSYGISSALLHLDFSTLSCKINVWSFATGVQCDLNASLLHPWDGRFYAKPSISVDGKDLIIGMQILPFAGLEGDLSISSSCFKGSILLSESFTFNRLSGVQLNKLIFSATPADVDQINLRLEHHQNDSHGREATMATSSASFDFGSSTYKLSLDSLRGDPISAFVNCQLQ